MCDAIFPRLFQRHNISCIIYSKQCGNIWRWSEGMMEKNSITIVKWTNRVENGVKRRVDGNFHWRVQNLWQSASKRWRSTATAPISVSGGPDAREYHSVPHFFFFSPLCIFSPIFLPPPSLSVLLFTVATTADICVAVIEQHCFGKNLFHGIVRPRCNCAVLMSEEDVRWYRNVDFRMIDDEM